MAYSMDEDSLREAFTKYGEVVDSKLLIYLVFLSKCYCSVLVNKLGTCFLSMVCLVAFC